VAEQPFLEFRGVSRTFRGGDAPFSLSGVDFAIPLGRTASISGSSGSGKSTFLNLAASIDRPDSGAVLCRGESISDASESRRAAWRAGTVGFVFQHHHLPSGMRCVDAVAAPLLWAKGVSPAVAIERAHGLLRSVGLEAFARQSVERLSGGQRQRVAVARALVAEPALVLADEPTAQLDRGTATRVVDLLRAYAQRPGVSMMVVGHENQPGDWGATMQLSLDGGRLARIA